MALLTWLLRLFLFFTLFAFALNNSQDVVVHWFFGYQWRTPMVIVVLVAFALGATFGIAAMVPAWLRQRKSVRRLDGDSNATPQPPSPASAPDGI